MNNNKLTVTPQTNAIKRNRAVIFGTFNQYLTRACGTDFINRMLWKVVERFKRVIFKSL